MNNYDAICKMLKDEKVEHEIFEHEGILTYEEGIQRLKFDPNKIVKTLAFKIEDIKILIALLGKDKLDYKKISELLSIKRNQLKMLSEEEVTDLGFEPGGICPIAPDKKVRVLIDSKIEKLDYIYCGMSRRDRTLKIPTKDLKKLSKGVFADIAKVQEKNEQER